MAADCPSPQVLEDIALGREVPDHLRSHLEICPTCADQVTEIRQNQRFLKKAGGALRQAVGDPRAGSRRFRQTSSVDADGPVPGYELLEEISRGGQGVVYRAVQKATKRVAAVKMLLAGEQASSRQRGRFEREIEIAARLRHPNIVSIFDSGLTLDGRRFVAMEYVTGVNLDVFVRDKLDPLNEKSRTQEIVKITAQVASAVGHAHANGVIHRDIKPSNVIIDESGVPRILDFGLAREIEGGTDVTLTREFAGTPAFAAPEQFGADVGAIDARADVYSLGVLFYSLLCKKHPYPVSGSLGALIEHVRTTEPVSPSRHLPRLPADLDVITLKALAKEPERRYSNAAALAGDLEDYLAGRPISARRDSTLYVLQKLARKHRIPAAAIGFVVAAILFVLVWVSMMAGRLDRQRIVAENALFASNLYSARLLSKVGDTVTAERQLWKAALDSGLDLDKPLGLYGVADARRVAWALMEFYAILPRRFIARTEEPPLFVGFGSDKNSIWAITNRGGVERWTLDGARISRSPALIPAPVFPVGETTGRRSASATRDGKRVIVAEVERACFYLIDYPTGNVREYRPEQSEKSRGCSVSEDGNWFTIASVSGEFRVLDWKSQKTVYVPKGRFSSGSWGGNDLALYDVVDESVWLRIFSVHEQQVKHSIRLGPIPAAVMVQGGRGFSIGPTGVHGLNALGSIVSVVNLATNSCELELANLGAPISGPAIYAPDGRSAMMTANEGTILLCSIPDYENQRKLKGMMAPLKFDYDGVYAVTAHSDSVAIWRMEEAPWPLRIPASDVSTQGLAVSCDGTMLAAGNDFGELTLSNSSDGVPCFRTSPAPDGCIRAVAFHPTDRQLITAGDDGVVRVWDTMGELQYELPTESELYYRMRAPSVGDCIYYARWSPDGRRIVASNGRGMLFIWEVASVPAFAAPVIYHMDSSRVPQFCFTHDSRTIFTISGSGLVVARDLEHGGKEVWRSQFPPLFNAVRAIELSPDGKTLAIGSDDKVIHFVDARNGALLRTLSGLPWGPFDLEYHPSGKVLFVCGRGSEILVVDPETCNEIASFAGHKKLVISLRRDPSGRFLYSAGEDNWIGSWDLDELRMRVRGNAAYNLNLLATADKTVPQVR